MKKATLLLTIMLLTLTGCGSSDSDKSADSKKASKEVSDEQSPSEESASTKEVNYDELFLEKISEYPIELTGYTYNASYSRDKFHEEDVCLYMTEPTIDSVTKDGVTAHGILCDDTFATLDELTITFLFDEATGDKYSSLFGILSDDEIGFCGISRESEEIIHLTPAIPFSTDMFFSRFNECKISRKSEPGLPDRWEYVDFSKDEFTISPLDSDGWIDSFHYCSLVFVTDSAGNQYRTSIEYEIRYKLPYSKATEYQWVFNDNDYEFEIYPLEDYPLKNYSQEAR